MNPVPQVTARPPAFAPPSLHLRCGCLSQPTRIASSCTSRKNPFLARDLRRERRSFFAPCSSDIAPGELTSTAPLKWVDVCTGCRSVECIRKGLATTMSPIGLLRSKKAQTCLSPAAASLSPPSPEEHLASGSSEGLGPKIDLNLPRRRLQLSFTCDACGARSQRLINPDAYARGTVFVQCEGCEVYHKLVDNLGLIEEYDFRQEANNEGDGADVNGME